MIGPATPLRAPEAWDKFRIQGVDTPGRCKVSGFERAVDWDTKVGKGTAGSTQTVQGLPPAKGSVTFWIWTDLQWEAWDRLLPLLLFDPTKKTKLANSVYHPALADINVDSVNIESISIWEETGNPGEYSRVIKMMEFAPPAKKSAAATPKGATPGSQPGSTPGSQPDPAIVALQKERDDLMAQAQKAYG